jgi:hypothetical protein
MNEWGQNQLSVLFSNLNVMKKFALSLFIFQLFFPTIQAQYDLPEVTFEGIEEDWHYISKDTNFVKSPIDKWSSPYWNLVAWNVLTDQSDIYIQEKSASQSPYGGVEGCLVHKLDIETGEAKWIYHNNTYSGNVFREMYSWYSMSKIDNGDIQIVGLRDKDTIDKTKPIFLGFSGQPVKKVLDRNNGLLVEEVSSKDTFNTYYTLAPNQARVIPVGNNNIVDIVQSRFEDGDGKHYFSLDIFDIGENMQIDTPFVQRFEDSIGVWDNVLAYFYPPSFAKLNQDTLILLFAKTDTTNSKLSPNNVVLKWTDLSDLSQKTILKELNITDLVYYPQSSWNDPIYLTTIDDHIIIRQKVEENGVYGKNLYWMAWLDKNGKVLGYLPEMTDEEGNYYADFSEIGVRDDILYFAAHINGEENDQIINRFDILSMEAFSNQTVKIGEIIPESSIDLNWITMRKSIFLPNDNILINLNIVFNNDEGYKTDFNLYCSFKPEQLGLPVKNENLSPKELQVVIFPNPTQDKVTITFPTLFTGVVELNDETGRLLQRFLINKKIHHVIKMTDFCNGVYFIQGFNSDGFRFSEKIIYNNIH